MNRRGKLISGNWKMNKGPKDSREFLGTLAQSIGLLDPQVEAMVFAPYISLEACVESSRSLPLRVGAQNAHGAASGAFTGEVSGKMLQDIGVFDALIAHSERRTYFGETNSLANARMKGLCEIGFRVTYCFGETLAEYKAGKTWDILQTQLSEGLAGLEKAIQSGQIVLAYEPVWAIGTGLTPTVEEIGALHAKIRNWIRENFDGESANRLRIQYGGSVTPDNAVQILGLADVDGALVGGASLKPESFLKLLQAAGEALDVSP
jgi:triosephosphate isomerase